jgi:L-asparaginase/Glu-tRNA(Gln) amidotransferase subunit D
MGESSESGGRGLVHPAHYAAGEALVRAGVQWAGEMTPECAYVKTALILGQGARATRRFAEYWKRDFAGEG